MKLVPKPFESEEEERKCKEFEEADRKHREEFFSNLSNIGRPYFPLFISTRILVDEKDVISGKYKDYRDKSNGKS